MVSEVDEADIGDPDLDFSLPFESRGESEGIPSAKGSVADEEDLDLDLDLGLDLDFTDSTGSASGGGNGLDFSVGY
jgi:hypothetical protein